MVLALKHTEHFWDYINLSSSTCYWAFDCSQYKRIYSCYWFVSKNIGWKSPDIAGSCEFKMLLDLWAIFLCVYTCDIFLKIVNPGVSCKKALTVMQLLPGLMSRCSVITSALIPFALILFYHFQIAQQHRNCKIYLFMLTWHKLHLGFWKPKRTKLRWLVFFFLSGNKI